MRLIDSGSGIGHGYDAVTNLAPVYMCSRGLRHLSAPPLSVERDGGTAGNVDRVRAGEQGSTARHSTRAWRRCGLSKHANETCGACVCMCSCD